MVDLKLSVMAKIIAKHIGKPLDIDELPDDSAWKNAPAVTFCSDWRGQNPDPERETAAQLLWSGEAIYLRFRCRYRTLFVYQGGNSRRDKLWERDVAEVFIQPHSSELRQYKEFEISPNGDWLDLAISPGEKSILFCSMNSRVTVDQASRIWTAEIKIPIGCIVEVFDPSKLWRLNLFRIEGQGPDRFYSAWQPTHAPKPNFHVPEVFGNLQFEY